MRDDETKIATRANPPRVRMEYDHVTNGVALEIDQKLGLQVNEIIHDQRFVDLERAWQGLHFLVSRIPESNAIQIRFIPLSKKELIEQFREAGVGRKTHPTLFEILHDDFRASALQLGCLVGDFDFHHKGDDLGILTNMAHLASTFHFPFLAAASPEFLQLECWKDLGNRLDPGEIVADPEYEQWNDLRDSSTSRYVCLTMPRMLGRYPYGADNPVTGFAFNEDTQDTRNLCWINSAYAMASCMGAAFDRYRWFARIQGIESGGAIENLPLYGLPSDQSSTEQACLTEAMIGDRQEAMLAKCGLMPLMHRKNSDFAFFISGSSIQRPLQAEDPDEAATLRQHTRLPYLMSTCRLVHYLRCIAAHGPARFQTAAEWESHLNGWMEQYLDEDVWGSTLEMQAQRPYAAARVRVEPIDGRSTLYRAVLHSLPTFQLECMLDAQFKTEFWLETEFSDWHEMA